MPVGEIKVTRLPEFDVVEWKVKDFSTITEAYIPGKISPTFEARGSQFDFTLCQSSENENYISLQFWKFQKGPTPSSVTFLMKVGDTWITTTKCDKECQGTFGSYHSSDEFVKISELETSLKCYNTSVNSKSAKSVITDANRYSFTIVCLISSVDSFEQCHVSTQTAYLQDCTPDAKDLCVINTFSEHETVNEKWSNEEFWKNQGMQSLSNNLKELYLNKEHSDVKIKVGPKEFSAHKNILSARSPVFASMFRHEMAENLNGALDISDCDPKSFEVFIQFLYTGKMDGVCYSNAIGLYKTADKYSVEDLKERCVSCLRECREVEYICDILEMASMHEEAKLLENAIKFFIENVKNILGSAKWQKFMAENSALANECLKNLAQNKL